MARSTVDPITRIEGHLGIEMEVEDGRVSEAWASGGLFRGMEHALRGRTPYDAALVAQRICGVCPVSHAHASAMAAEQALGIQIPEGARLVRNIAEGAQILHSTILWFYNLNGLDYINPLNALNADPMEAYEVCQQYGTRATDFKDVHARLTAFAQNGQLSIFSGNWYDCEDADGTSAYKLTPAEDLVGAAHYFEGLENQAKASQICAMIGGKMPHVMTSIPGGTSFMPTIDKLDEVLYRIRDLRAWISGTMVPDMLMIAERYTGLADLGAGPGRYVAYGVLDRADREMSNRYLPSGMVTVGADGAMSLMNVDASLITEDVTRSFYENGPALNPTEGRTQPLWPDYGKDYARKYTWSKAPRYDGVTYEAGGVARVLAAYIRGVDPIRASVDDLLAKLNLPMAKLNSVLGRIATRVLEAAYVADIMEDMVNELTDLMAAGEAEYYTAPEQSSGAGMGLWEAPRGALLHYEQVDNNTVSAYQIIIPSTWNLSPRDSEGTPGPLEQALVGTPVVDLEKPIDAVRIVHSFDPCTACACHLAEPKTGRSFSTLTTPWGVR